MMEENANHEKFKIEKYIVTYKSSDIATLRANTKTTDKIKKAIQSTQKRLGTLKSFDVKKKTKIPLKNIFLQNSLENFFLQKQKSKIPIDDKR